MALPKEAAELLVKKINESLDSGDVSNNDLSRWLSGAVCEIDDSYCYMYDFIGDGETGFVVYSCGGDLKRAPYRVTNSMGKMSVDIDDKAGIEVTVQTNYIAKESALAEAGARHSAGDRAKIQTVHDHSVALGASCAAKEAADAEERASFLSRVEAAAAAGRIQVFTRQEDTGHSYYTVDCGAVARDEAGAVFARRRCAADDGFKSDAFRPSNY